MAFAFTKELSDALANHLLRNVAHTSPATVYLALQTDASGNPTDPGEATADIFANEVSHTSYQRQAITFSAPTGGDTAVIENDTVALFPAVDVGEGPIDVTGVSIWDAERGVDLGSSGACLISGAIDVVKELADTDSLSFPVGSVQITID